jgi:uncharacterized protein YneF (UPF0154 family)
MAQTRFRFPTGLAISIVVTLILGFAAGPFIEARATPEQMARNVLLSAIPFILIFAAIILTYIAIITIAAGLLNDNISQHIHRPIELVLIAGILLGIFGMFQPWIFGLYKTGFFILLVSTLGFILWSHVVPRSVDSE